MRLSILTSRHVFHKIRYKLSIVTGEKKRENFLNILPKNSIGAELGVLKGEFTKHILEIVRPKELHLIDLWWKIGEYFHWGGDSGNLKTREAFLNTKRIVEEIDSKKVSIFHVGDDLAYLKNLNDHYFDWVYIDSSHKYEHTKEELELLRFKVKPGGIIAGHDWYTDATHKHHGVYIAVSEFCEKYNWRILELDGFSQWCIESKA